MYLFLIFDNLYVPAYLYKKLVIDPKPDTLPLIGYSAILGCSEKPLKSDFLDVLAFKSAQK